MKRYVFCCMFFFFVLSAQAQRNDVGVVFAEESYNFGLINESGGLVTHDFEFTNKGTSPIVLKSVRASCGCTTPNYPKAPIAPGVTNKISVTYNPQGRPGVFSKSITVVIGGDANKQTTYVLKISGEVIREKYPIKIGSLSLERERLSFKEIKKGAILIDSIGVYNSSEEPFLVSFPNCPKYLSIKIIPQRPLEGQRTNYLYPTQTGVMKITYNSKKSEQWGNHVDTLAVALNGKIVKTGIDTKLFVFAFLKENFDNLTAEQRLKAPIAELEKLNVSLGAVKKGTGKKVAMTLKNVGISPLKIRYVDSMCDFVKVTYDKNVIDQGKSVILNIELLPFELPEIHFQKRIELVTNDPSVPKQYITLEWDVVK